MVDTYDPAMYALYDHTPGARLYVITCGSEDDEFPINFVGSKDDILDCCLPLDTVIKSPEREALDFIFQHVRAELEAA